MNGNEVLEWILKQRDLWLEEQRCFHIGNLQERYLEQHAEQAEKFGVDFTRRVVALESHIAKHHVYDHGWDAVPS